MAKSCNRAVGRAVFFRRGYWHDRQVDDDRILIITAMEEFCSMQLIRDFFNKINLNRF